MSGLSENIRVISIVGRFLEHSRIFYFENAGQPKVFLSSADWMPRNFFRRIELAFPVENQALRDQIINEVLPSFLHDRVKARELQPDGTYRRLKPEGPEQRAQAQWHFREVSRERAKKMTGSKKKLRADKLTPITVATDPSVATSPDTESSEKAVPSATTAPGSPKPAATRKQS
jgi:Polyphosphate kinase